MRGENAKNLVDIIQTITFDSIHVFLASFVWIDISRIYAQHNALKIRVRECH